MGQGFRDAFDLQALILHDKAAHTGCVSYDLIAQGKKDGDK